MKQYAGLDVSLKEISICVVDVDGAVLVRGTVLTEPEAVASFLAKHQITPERIVHESGQLSIWLQRGLEKLGCRSLALMRAGPIRRCLQSSTSPTWQMRRGWPIWRAMVGLQPYTSGAKPPTGCVP